MDSDRMAFCETCVCGKTFSQPGTFTHHKRICSKTKKRLAEALVKAKEVWSSRKKRRIGMAFEDVTIPSSESQLVGSKGSSTEDVMNEDTPVCTSILYLSAALLDNFSNIAAIK